MIPLLGIVCGAATIWVCRRFAGSVAAVAAVKRVQAQLLEFWIYVDEQRTIWKSWKRLLAANARLLLWCWFHS